MNYAIIDVETTGTSSFNGKITEIAVYVHNGIEITDSFCLNPCDHSFIRNNLGGMSKGFSIIFAAQKRCQKIIATFAPAKTAP